MLEPLALPKPGLVAHWLVEASMQFLLNRQKLRVALLPQFSGNPPTYLPFKLEMIHAPALHLSAVLAN